MSTMQRRWLLSAVVFLGLGGRVLIGSPIAAQAAVHEHTVIGHGTTPKATLFVLSVGCNADGTEEFDLSNRSALIATGAYTITSGAAITSAPFTLNPGGFQVVTDTAPAGSSIVVTYGLSDGTQGSAVAAGVCAAPATSTAIAPTSTVSSGATATPGGLPGPGAPTPELGSGELVMAGLIPLAGLLILRRRNRR